MLFQKKIKIRDMDAIFSDQIIIVLKKYRHSISKEYLRDIRIDMSGNFNKSMVSFKTVNESEWEELMKKRIK